MRCTSCGVETQSEARQCPSCGTGFQSPVPENAWADLNPPLSVAASPRRPLFRRPLTSDWTFWLFFVLVLVGGTQSTYRNAALASAIREPAALFMVGAIEIAGSLLLAFTVLALIPALLRKLILMPNDRRAWATTPNDPSQGWRPDPARISELRWWNGSTWTNNISPGTSIGQPAQWILLGLLITLIMAFIAGVMSQRSLEAPPNSDVSNVGEALLGFGQALQSYGEIQANPDDPLAVLPEAQRSFRNVEANFDLLKTALDGVTSQGELGQNAPDIGVLRNLIRAAEPFIRTQRDYYTALGECSQLPGGLSSPDCDFSNLERAETQAAAAVRPFTNAWNAVAESIPIGSDSP